MRAFSALLCTLAACAFQPGAPPGGTPMDATQAGDSSVVISDAAPACASWQARHVDTCTLPPSPGGIILDASGSPYTYDTTVAGGALTNSSSTVIAITSAELTQTGNVTAALWTVTSLAVEANVELRVVGTKPLLLAAWETIDVEGTIDAGSYNGGRTGAGSNPAACATHVASKGADGNSGTGGGGGGGFRGAGGRGGDGDGNGTLRAGGAGGTAVAAPTILIGGCNGGTSGADNGNLALGGRGGGGLVLAARTGIVVSGRLLAGGGGGAGDASTSSSYGGGGGGSGGLLGLDAPTIDVRGATLAANGGGGGGGAVIAATASAGEDGRPSGSAASGGGGSGGEVGGVGSSINQLNGAAVQGNVPNGGGGGGGGGAGYVLHWGGGVPLTSGAVVSPSLEAGP